MRRRSRIILSCVAVIIVGYIFLLPPFSLHIEADASPKTPHAIINDPPIGKDLPYHGPNRFLRVTIRGYKFISFGKWQPWYPREGTYIVHLFNLDGKEITEKPYDGIETGEINQFITLWPGATFEDEAIIYREAYDINHSGKFRVQIERNRVRSNIIEIDME